jgi:hypothetical protein
VDGEIHYPNANTDAYAPDIDVDEGEAKESYVGDSKYKDEEASLGDKVGVAKSASIACSLESRHSNQLKQTQLHMLNCVTA